MTDKLLVTMIPSENVSRIKEVWWYMYEADVRYSDVILALAVPVCNDDDMKRPAEGSSYFGPSGLCLPPPPPLLSGGWWSSSLNVCWSFIVPSLISEGRPPAYL